MIAPVPYGHCLGALEVLLNSEIYNFPITRRQAFQKRSIQACSFIMFLLLFCYPGLNEKGEEVSWRTTGYAARIIQHEVDHLRGKLFIDTMDPLTFLDKEWPKWNIK